MRSRVKDIKEGLVENKKRYGLYYSEKNFWAKIKRAGRSAGKKVLYPALLLFYVLQKKGVPAWAKAVAVGALGYFIFPLDIIPDVAPLLGFTDDLSMLVAAVWTVAGYIDEEIREQAKNKLSQWFPDDHLDIDSIS